MSSFLRREYFLHGSYGFYTVVRSFDAAKGEREMAVRPDEAAWFVRDWLRDRRCRPVLLRIFHEQFGSGMWSGDGQTEYARERMYEQRLTEAFGRGDLVMIKTRGLPKVFRDEGAITLLEDGGEGDLGPGTVTPAPAPPPEDFLEILVFDAVGSLLTREGATLEVGLADGRRLTGRLERGRALFPRIEGNPPTACSLNFRGFDVFTGAAPADVPPPGLPDPAALASARGPVLDPKHAFRRDIAAQTFQGELNATNVFQLRRRDVVCVEFEHFRAGRALFLPGPAPSDVRFRRGVDERPDGIDVLRACLDFAPGHPNDKILVAGHAATLSTERATCVKLLLVGDLDSRAAWIELARSNGTIEEQDAFLAWADAFFSALEPEFPFGCTPAPDEPRDGSPRSSVEAFQRAYNRDVGRGRFPTAPILPDGTLQTIRVTGRVGGDTYGAFFDCVMRALRPAPTESAPATDEGPFEHLPFIEVVRGKNFVPFQVALDAGFEADRYVDMNPFNPSKPLPGDRGWRPTFPGEIVILPPTWNDRVPNLVAHGWRAHRGTRAKPAPVQTPVAALASPGPRAVGCGASFLTNPFPSRDGRRARERAVEVLFGAVDEPPAVYDPREYDFAYPSLAALQQREPFFLSVPLAGRSPDRFTLFIQDGSGRVDRVLRAADAQRGEDLLVWRLVPAELPNPTLLVLLDGRRRHRLASAFDPTDLRDALVAGDMERVSDVVDFRTEDTE